jgi:tRNA threonylcarbamoyladenosine dehydratase
VRKKLRAEFGFPIDAREKFGIESLFSTEPVVYPHRDGTVCVQREPGSELKLDCQSGYGTASFVTGAFGLMAAGLVVRELTSGRGPGFSSE